MSVWTRILGTIETSWQIGLGGPRVKANAGVLEARDAADAAFVKLRALDPAAASDVATKNYVDTGAGGGAIRCVKYPIVNTPASQDSTTVIPANAIIHRREVEVTTPYSGGATIAIGQAGSTSLLMGTTDINPQAAGVYVVDQNTSWGAAVVTVFWSLPTN